MKVQMRTKVTLCITFGIIYFFGLGTISAQTSCQSEASTKTKKSATGSPNQKTALSHCNGIFVDAPKVYDEASLEALFNQAQTNLNQLNAFNSTTLQNGISAIQGAVANQSQIAAQASLAGITGLASKTSQTVTNPTIPALPTAPAFALPSSFSPSASDLLGQQTQLSFQIINLQLLLQGPLSDKIIPGTNIPKSHLTLGFPISINVPTGYQYQHAVAEVEVTICSGVSNPHNDPNYDPNFQNSRPSVVVLLPQAKTYNVASIVNKSSQISGGAIANVVNLGGNWLRGRQTYYLVQDQDTLAVQRSSGDNACPALPTESSSTLQRPGVTFAWQFKPVLGQTVVQDGLRQTLVQLSFPIPFGQSALSQNFALVYAKTSWRKYDKATGRVGDLVGTATNTVLPNQYFSVPPIPYGVTATDNGDGTLAVEATGGFRTGTTVQIGNTVIDATAPASVGFAQTTTYVKFNAPALDIATKGATLVSRDGTECQIVAPKITSGETAATVCYSPGSRTSASTGGLNSSAVTSRQSPVGLPADFPVTPATSAAPITPPTNPLPAPQKPVLEQKPKPQEGAKPASSNAMPENKLDLKKFIDSQNFNISAFITELPSNLIRATRPATTPNVGNSWTVNVSPFSDTMSLILLSKSNPDIVMDFSPLGTPVVVIGSKLFGLKDAPFRDVIGNFGKISLLVPNDLLQSSSTVMIKTLFRSAEETSDAIIPIDHTRDVLTSGGVTGSDPSGTTAPVRSGFAITNVKYLFSDAVAAPPATVAAPNHPPAAGRPAAPAGLPKDSSDTHKKTYYAVTGSHLENLEITGPSSPEATWEFNTKNEPTLKIFSLNDQPTNLKSMVFRDGNGGPLVLEDLPAVPSATPATTTAPKIDAQTATAVGATKVTLVGTGLDQIVSIRYLDTALQFTPPKPTPADPKKDPPGTKKLTLDVTLPIALSSPGLTLTIMTSDKSLMPYSVLVPLPAK